jgi:hypothetical protein
MQLPDNPMRLLIEELENVSPDGRATYIETLVAFSKFARSCDLSPAWRRLYQLAARLDDLDYGRVDELLTPRNTGRGTAPDSFLTWNDRVLALAAFAMLLKAGMGQQEAARYIAKKYPALESLMKRGKKLSDTILRWRRDLYDARPGDFLHRFGIDLAEHENFINAQSFEPQRWKLFANSLLAQLSERV